MKTIAEKIDEHFDALGVRRLAREEDKVFAVLYANDGDGPIVADWYLTEEEAHEVVEHLVVNNEIARETIFIYKEVV